MLPSIGNFSSIAPVAHAIQAAAAAPSSAAANSQAVQDRVAISEQARTASAKIDSDGDGH